MLNVIPKKSNDVGCEISKTLLAEKWRKSISDGSLRAGFLTRSTGMLARSREGEYV